MMFGGFFTPEAGRERRQWLEGRMGALADGLQYYAGPGVNVNALAQIADAFNPVSDIGRAGTAAQGVVRPGASVSERISAFGNMATDIASVAAPVGAAAYSDDAVRVLEDALLGASFGAREFGRHVGMVANQPGPLTATGDDTLGAFRVWHGSPHDFDRFSMDKIGTGEGAQAYGHGLYFAENERVAKGYRDTLSGNRMMSRTLQVDGNDWFDAADLDRNALKEIYPLIEKYDSIELALDELKDRAANSPLTYIRLRSADLADYLEKNIDRIDYNAGGRLYEVEINANPEDFLDWDAPLSAQPRQTRETLRAAMEARRPASEREIFGAISPAAAGRMKGGEAYRALHPSSRFASDEASATLREAGIPGIRYLDAGSRGAGDGSRNYVVFDENIISILNKYGMAGILGLSASQFLPQEQPY